MIQKRVVTDTNVLVSAVLSPGGASDRLVVHVNNRHTIILCEAILDELLNTLINKFRYSFALAYELIEGLREIAEIVEPATFDTQICRDPDDDAILGTAIAGNADCIVTGDNDLLVLERFQGVDIISPSEFARYEAERF